MIPPEQLSPGGISSEFLIPLASYAGWTPARAQLVSHAFELYWSRTTSLAARSRDFLPPRRRHLIFLPDHATTLPYAQLLNTSAWTLYDTDSDPAVSNAEFLAYLLVHGDRMAITGEVTQAALRNAAYWIERTAEERSHFAAAAQTSRRSDGDAYRLLAAALAWLPRLYHQQISPAPPSMASLPISGSPLSVPPALREEPLRLVNGWQTVAQAVLRSASGQRPPADPATARRLAEWLASERPPLNVYLDLRDRLWSTDDADDTRRIEQVFSTLPSDALDSIAADLRVATERTRIFLASLVDIDSLPNHGAAEERSGYVFLEAAPRRLGYNLGEPGLDRLQRPAPPFARAMLGARCIHEWAHLAVDAGWVPNRSPDGGRSTTNELASLLDEIVAGANDAVSSATADDLHALRRNQRPGDALAALLLQRTPDYQSNLLAQRYLTVAERETYIRQNIRSYIGQYPAAQLWRKLVRYLYELQYLRFSAIDRRIDWFLDATWFRREFLDSGVLTREQLERIDDCLGRHFAAYAPDDSRFRILRS